MAERKHRFGASTLTKLQAHRLGRPIQTRAGYYRLVGEIHTIRDGTRDDASWIAGTLRVEHGADLVGFVGKGVGGLEIGRRVDVVGYWNDHPEFGIQLQIERVIRTELPRESQALIRYLAANVPGVGKKRGEELVKIFGAKVLQKLFEDPEIPRRLWKGATAEAIALGVQKWRKQLADEQWSMEIAPKLMEAAGIGYPLARRVCSYFSSAEVADLIIRRDAYRLLEVPGIGWETSDAVARDMGIEADADARCRGALQWSLTTLRDKGHSAVPRSALINAAEQLSGVGRKRIARALAGLVVDAEVVRANGLLYEEEVLAAEWEVEGLVRWLASMNRRPVADDAAKVARVLEQHLKLTAEQRDAVCTALGHGISILTGGPGTGKTTVLRVIVEAAQQLGIEVTIVAPTGKAASRATQVTGHRAFTIHKLLGGPPGSEREKGPLRRGLLIVEEASMLDLESAAWLASNVLPGKDFRLLIVGDENQLPSVGHGQVLADLIASGVVPAVTLTRIQRQEDGSTITEQAHRLLRKEPLVLQEAADFRFVELPGDATRAQAFVLAAATQLVQEERSSLTRRITGDPFDPCRDMQVLTPRNSGPLGVAALNPLLGSRFNPRPEPGPWIGGGQRVRLGDRVMCTENDYTVGEEGIFNGEQGIVTSFDENQIELRMDDGRRLTTRGIQNLALTLAFAVTVHKSQGSEYPAVVVVFHSSQVPLLDQRVLYTALTRAKQRVVLCAERRALQIAQQNFSTASHRWTGLQRMLK